VSLRLAKPLYFLPRDSLAEEVLIPGFNEAASAACMVGFFSSSVLADLAPGLAITPKLCNPGLLYGKQLG
jgi:hypothetical protein